MPQFDFLPSYLGGVTPQPEVQPPLSLSSGSTGEDVAKLQQQLKQLGAYPGEIDGDFGPKTLGAVQKFQKDKGLQVDGLAGPKTKTVLDTLAPPPIGFTQMPEIPSDAFAQAISNAPSTTLPKPAASPASPLSVEPGQASAQPGIKGGQVTLLQEPKLAQPGGVPMKITGLESFPQYGKEKPPSKEEMFAEMLGGAPIQAPGIKKIDFAPPTTAKEATPPVGGIPGAKVKTTKEKLDEFFASPIVQQSLAEFGAALDPQGFAGRLAQGTISQAQGKMFQNYVGRLLAGESPEKIKGLDVAGMTPQMVQSAIREAESIKSGKFEKGITSRDIAVKESEAASRQALRKAQVKEINDKTAIELAKVSDGWNKLMANNAYSVIKSAISKLPEGASYKEALLGGQKVLTDNEMTALKGAVRTLTGLGLDTFGLEKLIKGETIPTITSEEEFNSLKSGQEFIYNGKKMVKK